MRWALGNDFSGLENFRTHEYSQLSNRSKEGVVFVSRQKLVHGIQGHRCRVEKILVANTTSANNTTSGQGVSIEMTLTSLLAHENKNNQHMRRYCSQFRLFPAALSTHLPHQLYN